MLKFLVIGLVALTVGPTVAEATGERDQWDRAADMLRWHQAKIACEHGVGLNASDPTPTASEREEECRLHEAVVAAMGERGLCWNATDNAWAPCSER